MNGVPDRFTCKVSWLTIESQKQVLVDPVSNRKVYDHDDVKHWHARRKHEGNASRSNNLG